MKQIILDAQSEVNNSDRVKVISMLYDGAMNFMKTAKEKLHQGDTTGKTLYIRKTSAIIQELSNSLNMEGGEIAQNLRKLYVFVLDSLYKADMQNDLKAMSDAEKVMDILKDAWIELQEVKQAELKTGP